MNHMNVMRAFLGVVTISTLLTGCDSVRKTLGLDRDPPDEFSVLKRAPLSVPADLNVLPPPVDLPRTQNPENDILGGEDARPQELSPQSRAQKAVLGKSNLPQSIKHESSGEKALTQMIERQIPVDQERPENIRKTLDEETHIKTGSDKSWVKKILFWQKDKKDTAEALNPEEEYIYLHGTRPGDDAVTY